jgi:hypothetical protein
MVPYCRQVKSIVYFFCYCLPVAQFIFLRKRWMMPRHQIWVLLCTLWARITRHKLCVGEHQHVSGHHWAIQQYFSAIRTHCWLHTLWFYAYFLRVGGSLLPPLRPYPSCTSWSRYV